MTKEGSTSNFIHSKDYTHDTASLDLEESSVEALPGLETSKQIEESIPKSSSCQLKLSSYRWLLRITLLLTFILIILGAYVRKTDAGLGCPDWPGCYGSLTPSRARAEIARAVQEQGGEAGPVSMEKAWKEMTHRYVAKFLGLLSFAIALYAWGYRKILKRSPVLPISIFFLVVVQGIFGWLTVSMRLQPTIVVIHLMGGFFVLSLFTWLYFSQEDFGTIFKNYVNTGSVVRVRFLSRVAFFLFGLQLFLGGWTSANYAGLVCPDLPKCQGTWLPSLDFAKGFSPWKELSETSELPAQIAIHLSHRFWATVVLCGLLLLGFRAMKIHGLKRIGFLIVSFGVLQVILGAANAIWSLPVWWAVAHTAVAAFLCIILVLINLRVTQACNFSGRDMLA